MKRNAQTTNHLDERRRSAAADVRDDGIRVERSGVVGVAEAHRRFGGLDWLATIAGFLAALGALVLLGSLAGAAGSIGYQLDAASDEDLSIGGLMAGSIVLLISFFIGGWVAGRVARYDGGRNGVGAVLWFLLVAVALAALGAWLGDRYNLFERPDLPNWFSSDELGGAAIASAIGGVLLALVAGWLGGKVGDLYHKRADAVVTHTRDGAVAVPFDTTQEQAAPASPATPDGRGPLAGGLGTETYARRGR
jgi:hypothetical protein